MAAETITVVGPVKPDAPVAAEPNPAVIAPTQTQQTALWPWALAVTFALVLLGAGMTYSLKSKPTKQRYDLVALRRAALARAGRAAKVQNLSDLHKAGSEWVSCVGAQSKSAPSQVIAANAAFATGWGDLERHLFAPDTTSGEPFSHRRFFTALQAYDRDLAKTQRRLPKAPKLIALYPTAGLRV